MKITKEEILSSEVRLITLNEPFASLMAFHGKQETRNRDTKVRGFVAIHVAKQWYPDTKVMEISGKEQFFRILGLDIARTITGEESLCGNIIAIGRLVRTYSMEHSPLKPERIEELCFVKYDDGLWVWEFDEMTPIEPIPFKGSQGWSILTLEQKELLNPK